MAFLPRPSIRLNKSLTRLKSDLCWNTIASFWARNLTTYQVLFFVYHLGQKFFPPQTVLRQWHSSLDPQFIWISPWLGWKAIYVETLYSELMSAKFDNVSSTFFPIPPRSKILSPSDCTRTVTLLPRPSIHLNKSLTRLKCDLCWNIKYRILSAKFDNVSSTFFVYNLDRKFFPPQTIIGQWHSSLDPQFIWISPWLGWKAIYVETVYSEFLSAKFHNVSSTSSYTT